MSEHRDVRWRLVLGAPAEQLAPELGDADQGMDGALAVLYDAPDTAAEDAQPRSASLAASAPRVVRWLGDIRRWFPTGVVQVMQRDAVERLNLTSLLLEPELLESVQPDVHLVAALVGLQQAMPETTRRTARAVVAAVVAEIERRIAERTRSAVTGAVNRALRTRRPRPADIDWQATIRRNLAHYLPEHRTVVPEQLVGFGRRSGGWAKHVIVAVDQSGSMAESVVYAAVFGAVLSSIRSLQTSLVAFDTAVVDLSAIVEDPVDLLFGVQLGGGTDINRAVAYCADLVTRPTETVLVLISDLYEGGLPGELVKRMAGLVRSGVTVVVLLALAEHGTPAYDHALAGALAGIGIPSFGCTPDLFPDLLATALAGGDVARWIADQQRAAAAGPPSGGRAARVGGDGGLRESGA